MYNSNLHTRCFSGLAFYFISTHISVKDQTERGMPLAGVGLDESLDLRWNSVDKDDVATSVAGISKEDRNESKRRAIQSRMNPTGWLQ